MEQETSSPKEEKWRVKTTKEEQTKTTSAREQNTSQNTRKTSNQSGTRARKDEGFSRKYQTRGAKNSDVLAKQFANQEAKLRGKEDAEKELGRGGRNNNDGGARPPVKTPPPPKKSPAEIFAELPPTSINNNSAQNFSIKTGDRQIVELDLSPYIISFSVYFLLYMWWGFEPLFIFAFKQITIHVSFAVTLSLLVISFSINLWRHLKTKIYEPNYIEIKYHSPYTGVLTDKDYRHDVVGVGDLKHKDPYFIWVVQTAYARINFNLMLWKYVLRSVEKNFNTRSPVNGKQNQQKYIISLELYMQLEASKFANLMDTKEDIYVTIARAASNFQSVNIVKMTTLGGEHEKLVVNNTAIVAYYAFLEFAENRQLDFLLPLSRRSNFFTVIDTEKLNYLKLEMSRPVQLLHELALWIPLVAFLFKLLPLVP